MMPLIAVVTLLYIEYIVYLSTEHKLLNFRGNGNCLVGRSLIHKSVLVG